jgi:hypothetical protein
MAESGAADANKKCDELNFLPFAIGGSTIIDPIYHDFSALQRFSLKGP